MKAWPALISGALFGLGLTLSGMSDPAKVLGFLNITGAWISDLMFVMGGAVVATFLVTPLVTVREAPLLASTFLLPGKQLLDHVWLAEPCYLVLAGDCRAAARDLPWCACSTATNLPWYFAWPCSQGWRWKVRSVAFSPHLECRRAR